MRHIIYIPGLGDGYDPVRKLALGLWRRRNVVVSHVPMRWSDKTETYEQKLDRISDAIAKYPEHEITLVGESGGGPMALVAYQEHSNRVSRVVTLCGMNQGALQVNETYYEHNPAFKEAMTMVDQILPTLSKAQKSTVKTLYSSLDFTVRPKDTIISGASSYNLRVPSHLLSIAVVLFLRYRLITG